MPSRTVITAAAGLIAATGIVVTVASLANASSSTSPTATSGYAFGYGQQSGEGRGHGGPGGGTHTPVTGSQLAKVTAAVKAKDSTITVTSVSKEDDGSYDAFGTKAGARVKAEVSKDLKTVTVETGGPGDGRGGHGPDGDGPGAPGGTGTSGGTGTQSNGTSSNGSASTTSYRTV